MRHDAPSIISRPNAASRVATFGLAYHREVVSSGGIALLVAQKAGRAGDQVSETAAAVRSSTVGLPGIPARAPDRASTQGTRTGILRRSPLRGFRANRRTRAP